MKNRPKGLIAAAATPLTPDRAIDIPRLAAHCRGLLERGCDGINLLGTTGEATSFSVDERLSAMRAVAESGLPLERFLVGTGAANQPDAVALTRAAMALHKGTEAHQGDTVLAVQGTGNFFKYGVEYPIGLILGQVSLLGDGGGEFRFAHKCLFVDGLLLLCPCCSSRTAPRTPQRL